VEVEHQQQVGKAREKLNDIT